MFFGFVMTVSYHFFDYHTFSYIINPVKSDIYVLENIHIHLPVFNTIYCFPSFLSPLPSSQPFRHLAEEGVVYQAFPPWGLPAEAPACLTTVGQGSAGRETGKGVYFPDTFDLYH